MSSSSQRDARPVAGSAVTSRQLNLLEWALQSAIATAGSSPTLQEGLYEAYSRHLRYLDDLHDLPADLRDAITCLVESLRVALGFDAVTGQKTTPSVLGYDAAAVLLERTRVISETVTAIAASASIRGRAPRDSGNEDASGSDEGGGMGEGSRHGPTVGRCN